MRREFSEIQARELLVQCHRRCCVCHRYCGVKIEVDHIEGASSPGSEDIGNAIALCFDCHAEVHHYNAGHPKGRRFTSAELRAHRDQWLRMCKDHPEMFVQAQPAPEAGSLERLLAELEFNRVLASSAFVGGKFETTQFRRAIADGTFVWLPDDLKAAVHAAYLAMVTADGFTEGHAHRTQTNDAVVAALKRAKAPIEDAIQRLQTTI
jgi:HNH endonuclease